MKKCWACQELKDTAGFTKDSSRGDGLAARCRECFKAYREADPEKLKAKKAAYYTANKTRVLEARAAYREANIDKINTYRRANRAKAFAQETAYRKAHPDEVKTKRNNRRARKLNVGGKLTHGLAKRLFELQQGKCPCCSKPLGDTYHMDHIMPLALGGANEDWNIQLLRARCNIQKGAKNPEDFMRLRGFLL